MGSFASLKSWLTLQDATSHLAQLTGEHAVEEVDILRLAMDHRLNLSVVFTDRVQASPCHPVNSGEVEYQEVANLSGKGMVSLPIGGEILEAPGGALLRVADYIVELHHDTAFDLPLIGGELSAVQRRYWNLLGANHEGTTNLDGAFVTEGNGDTRQFFRLVDKLPFRTPGEFRGWYPVGDLPTCAVMVITQRSIQAFVAALAQAAEPTTNKTNERRWPWGDHHTELLGHLEDAARRFWMNVDPTDNTTAPTNETVSEWLQKRGVSKRMADMMASMLRADGLPTGPRTST